MALESPEGFAPCLALGSFAGDERLRRIVVPELRNRDRVDRSVELTVAASVEAHPARLARAGRDRCHAGEHREAVGRPKPTDVTNLGDDLGDAEDAGTRQRAHRVIADQLGDPSLERVRLRRERGEPRQASASELGLDARQMSQLSTNRPPVPLGDEVRRLRLIRLARPIGCDRSGVRPSPAAWRSRGVLDRNDGLLRREQGHLTSGPIQTTRGRATAPIWEFTVQGTAVKVTRVALADPVVVASQGEGDPQVGLAIDSASGTVGGRELTVAFVGAPDPGDKPCGEDYTAEAVESDLAAVVIVTRHPHVAPFGEACSAVGARRTASATMAAPLGERVVLDLQQGTPIPVVLAP